MDDTDFFVGNPAPDHPQLTLSTNPSLADKKPLGPTGPWKDMYPVKILNESTFIESVKRWEKLYKMVRPHPLAYYLAKWMLHFLQLASED
ncbi:hypothetical protein BDV10DRAFT_157152 [Aspergillus recurvatus]